MRKKPGRYSLLNRRNAKRGRISLLIGVAAAALLISGIVIAYRDRGEAGILVGVLGIAAFAVAVFGFIMGLLGFKEEDRRQLYSWIGSLLNAAVWLLLAGTFLAFV